MTRPHLTTVQVIAACLLCLSIAHAGKPGSSGGGAAYTIVPFDAGDSNSLMSQINDLNDGGEVVGRMSYETGFQSWHLDLASGVYTQLPFDAAAINNRGQIAGTSWDVDAPTVAYFLSSPGGEPVPLPPLDGDDETVATDINDAGIVIGFSRVDHSSFDTAVAWRPGIDQNGTPFVDGPVAFCPLDGDSWSVPARINDSSGSTFQVVGDSWAGGAREAVVWSLELDSDGALVAPALPVGLGTLAGGYSEGYAINGAGDACGESDLFPFVALAGGEMQPLPVPRDTQSGWANDLNDHLELVGQLDVHKVTGAQGTGWPEYHACLWRNGSVVDLETMIDRNSGWDQLWGANRISNGGVITGFGRYDVEHRGFILIPSE